MASAAEIAILIKARDEASKVLKDVGDNAGGLGKTLGDVGKAAAGFLAANVITSGVSALTGAISDSIAGFKEHQLVVAQTEAVLKSTGGAAGVTAKEINDMANSLKEATLFEDDAIQSGQNLLLTFTSIGKDVFPQATQTMLDMSQALGQDVKSSAIQLGKALNDPIQGVTALRRVGVSFTEEQLKQIEVLQTSGDLMGAQGIILAELGKEFGGSAKAASDAAGASAKYADKLDDLQDTIGEKLLPLQLKWKEAQAAVISFMLSNVLPVVQMVAVVLRDELAPAFEQARQLAERFSAFFATVIVPAVTAAGDAIRDKLGPPLQRFVGFMEEIGGKQALLIGIMAALTVGVGALAVVLATAAISAIAMVAPFIAIGAAIALLIAGVVLLVQHWDEITARFPIVGQAADALQQQFQKFTDWIMATFVPAVKNIGDTVADSVGKAVSFVTDNWDTIRAVIEPALQALAQIIQFQWDNIRVIFETVFGILQGLLDVFTGVFTGNWSLAWEGVRQIAQAAWDGIVGLIQNAVELIRGIVPIMLSVGEALIRGLADGATAFWNKVAWPGIRDMITALPGLIGDLGMLLWTAGVQIIEGLISGIKSMAGRAAQAVVDTVQGGVNAGLKALGIKSPSTVFHEMGVQMMQGLANGIASAGPAVLLTLAEWVEAMKRQGAEIVSTGSGIGYDFGNAIHDGVWYSFSTGLKDIRDVAERYFGEIMSSAKTATDGVGDHLNDWLTYLPIEMRAGAKAMGLALAEGIASVQPQFRDALLRYLDEVATNGQLIIKELELLPPELRGIAIQMGEAMIAGFDPVGAAFVDSVADAGAAAVAAARRAAQEVAAIFAPISAAAHAPASASNPVVPSAGGITQGQKDYIDWMNAGGATGMAHGGIVRARPGGTLALLGEGGQDEAVIPLDSARGGMGTKVYGNLQVVLPNVRNGDDLFGALDRAAAW